MRSGVHRKSSKNAFRETSVSSVENKIYGNPASRFIATDDVATEPAVLQREVASKSGISDQIKELEKSRKSISFNSVGGAAWVMSWLPGETLFSLASRLHAFSGHRVAKATCMRLFGHPYLGSAHDMPCRLDEFVARVGQSLGSAEEIARKRTVLGAYLPFLAPDRAGAAIEAMRSDQIGGLKSRLGLLASRFGAAHPLRSCPICMQEDRENHGVAYWHRAQQCPGYVWCSRHQTPLLEYPYKFNGLLRFQWHLPSEHRFAPFISVRQSDKISQSTLVGLKALMSSIEECFELPTGFGFDRGVIARVSRNALREKGLLRQPGQSIRMEAGRSLSEYLSSLACIQGLHQLKAEPEVAQSHIRRLLAPHRPQTCHPLRYLPVLTWLFGSWAEFKGSYDAISTENEGPTSMPTPSFRRYRHSDDIRAQVLRSIQIERISPTAAAQAAGVDRQTALTWAQQAGLRVKRKPKKLIEDVRRAIQIELRRGTSKVDVSERHKVSLVTVTRVLLADPELANQWRDQNIKRMQKQARQAWLLAIRRSRGKGVKQARVIATAAYGWLYRHDREWLNDRNSRLDRQVKGNHAKVDWLHRDLCLEKLIRDRCLKLVNQPRSDDERLLHVIHLVPELRTMLGKLDRLPRTLLEINKLTIKRSDKKGSQK